MKTKISKEVMPIISVIIVVLSLFVIVFLKMEVRRNGYIVYKVSKKLKKKQDSYRLKKIQYAKITRPDRLRYLALTRSSLTEAKKGQILHVSGDKIVVKH